MSNLSFSLQKARRWKSLVSSYPTLSDKLLLLLLVAVALVAAVVDADCNSKDFDFIGYQLCMYFKVNNIYLYNIKKDPAECTEEEILKIINK